MFWKLLCSATVLFLGSVGAWAQPTEPYTIIGAGASSCGRYLEVRSQNHRTPEVVFNETLMISWAQGYVSGMNSYRAVAYPKREMLVLPDAPSTKVYLDKYCRENPLKTLHDGTFALYLELEFNRR